jgi:hypothetical protein
LAWCDEEYSARLGDVSGMPDVARINRRLSVCEINTVFDAVDFLNERYISGDDNDDLLASRMSLPSRPARVACADHHESAFIAI